MKNNRITSLLLAATMATGLIAGPVTASAVGPTFTDVPETSWAYPYIEQAAADGIVSGVGGGRFNPTGTVSYSEFGTMIARAFCEDELATYESEESAAWWTPYMQAMSDAGLLVGTKADANEGTVSADIAASAINRFEMAQVMGNVIEKADAGIQAPDTAATEKAKSDISDWSSIPAEYQDAVAVCYAAGYLSGVDTTGRFNGNATMSRAEAATVMCRLTDAQAGETTPGGTTGTETTPEKPSGEVVATLPGNIKVYEEPVSVEEAMKTVAFGVNDTQMRPGKSTDGLIPAGTQVKGWDKYIEQQVYVDVGNGVPGILTTTFGETVRSTMLKLYMYPGDTITLDARSFGYDTPGVWEQSNDTLSIRKLDEYRAEIKVAHAGPISMGFETGHESTDPVIFNAGGTAFERRPAAGETADFTIESTIEPVLYMSPDPAYPEASQVWYTDKGVTFTNKETAHYLDDGIIGEIRIYPNQDSNVPKSALTGDGYVNYKSLSDYYMFHSTEETTGYLDITETSLSISTPVWPFPASADGTIATFTVTSLETGLSQSIDFTLKYLE